MEVQTTTVTELEARSVTELQEILNAAKEGTMICVSLEVQMCIRDSQYTVLSIYSGLWLYRSSDRLKSYLKDLYDCTVCRGGIKMCIRDRVYSYTGYELDKLEEKNGTYYTEWGENILDLVDSAVESSGKVPREFKQHMRNWIHDLVSTISTRGWNNVPDMTLSLSLIHI